MSENIQGNNARVCLFIPSFGDGGVERMLVNLAQGMTRQKVIVDFVVTRVQGGYLKQLSGNINLLEIKSANTRKKIHWLSEYLDRVRPSALISAKTSDDRIALQAKHLSRAKTPVFLRPGTHFSERKKAQKFHPVKRWLEARKHTGLFNAADGIIAVSTGVAEDVVRISGVSADKISVIQNPTITPAIFEQAKLATGHPWLEQSEIPVILGIGRLSRVKDYPTLLRAFKIVRSELKCRLIILGKGRQKEPLLQMAKALEITKDVDLPGFKDNPYAYLARASLFVLSSKREGSPNVLIEALALGIPSVSTDCRSGPAEIMQNGHIGPLVAVGDFQQLAAAMLRVMRNPPDADMLKGAVQQYHFDLSACRYLQALGLGSYCNIRQHA